MKDNPRAEIYYFSMGKISFSLKLLSGYFMGNPSLTAKSKCSPRKSNSKTLESLLVYKIMRVKNCNRMQNAAAFEGRRGGVIDVRNMHAYYMKFNYVYISLTRKKYWYEIRNIFFAA